jgi:hypothetical protein
LYIPICLLNFKNIIEREIYLKILSLGIIVVQWALIFIEMVINNDFKFDKTALNQGRNPNRKLIEFVAFFIMTFIYTLLAGKKKENLIILNVFNLFTSLCQLYDYHTTLHFVTKPYIRYLNMICILIYFFESIISISTVTIDAFQ